MEIKEFLPNYSDGLCERSERTSFVPFEDKELVVVQVGEGGVTDPFGGVFFASAYIIVPGFKMSEPHQSAFHPHPGAIDVQPIPRELQEKVEVELAKKFTEDILFW